MKRMKCGEFCLRCMHLDLLSLRLYCEAMLSMWWSALCTVPQLFPMRAVSSAYAKSKRGVLTLWRVGSGVAPWFCMAVSTSAMMAL